jgi:hypothetical protein
MERDVLHDAVALVEDAEHRDPLSHRRDARLVDAGRRPSAGRRLLAASLLLGTAAAGERQRKQERNGGLAHAYSGIQGS